MLNFRGKGTTTRQMQSAEIGSIFIWCNDVLMYPKNLAKKLNRHDLIIKSPSFLCMGKVHGLRNPSIVLDHATKLTSEQWQAYRYIESRTRI